MRLILDTQSILWYAFGDPALDACGVSRLW